MCLQRVLWLSLPPMTATTAHKDMSQTSTLEQHFHIREGKGAKMFSTVWKRDKMIAGLVLLLLPPVFILSRGGTEKRQQSGAEMESGPGDRVSD